MKNNETYGYNINLITFRFSSCDHKIQQLILCVVMLDQKIPTDNVFSCFYQKEKERKKTLLRDEIIICN